MLRRWIEGMLRKWVGYVKEVWGRLTGNKDIERNGQAQRVRGRIESAAASPRG